ncbi:MAG: T9SS type A sorting domain-containing protein [Chryseolinea sp.]
MKKFYMFLSLVCLTTTAFPQCWKFVSPGSAHTVAINNDGTLWAWGFNASGQLGDGTGVEKDIPVQISTQNIWKTVSAGGSHTLAIQNDGTLWAWGDNLWGQVGDGTFGNVRQIPIKIGTATNWAAVSAGQSFSMAIKTDGTLWAWGDNFYGQLGNGEVAAYAPKQVGTATDWKLVSTGGQHTVALRNDNTIWSWGLNLDGQLGDGTLTNRPAPVKIGVANDWKSIDAGYNHTLALAITGGLWGWGNNDDGQLGNGSFVARNIPTQIGGSVWKSIAAGENNTLGLRTDGTIWAWGYIIGGVVFGEEVSRNTPMQLLTNNKIESISLGDDHAFAFGVNGSLWTWGKGTWGKLGDDSWIDKNHPQILFTAPPTGPLSQLFCKSNALLSELSVSGTNVLWYNATTGGSPLASTTPLADGGHYYATQTRTGCESQTRLEVIVSFRPTPAGPTGNNSFTFCDGEKLVAVATSGNDIKWYSASTGGAPIPPESITLVDDVHYYASQTLDGCESTQRLDVVAIQNLTPVPTTLESTQTFCQPSSLAELVVNGTSVRWYADETGGPSIPVTTPLVSGTAYFATSTVGSLESCTRLKVTGNITNAKAPTGEGRQAFCNGGQVALLKATGTGIQWYDVPTGGVALTLSEPLADGLYYASQTIGLCESPDRLRVQVVINLLNTPTPTGVATQIVCDQTAIRDLAAIGQNIKWYFTDTGGAPILDAHEALETSYFATQTIDACESQGRLQVTVVTNKVKFPDLPTATPLRARMVSGGYQFSVAIMEDGTLWSWGDNTEGTLGDGTRVTNLTPTMINAETDWTFIDAGNAHVLALKSNGTLWAWGSNEAGQLGDGTETDRLVPTQIGTDTDWRTVAAGGSHTLALKTDGTLWSCGWNYAGQTGIVTDRGWPLIGLHQVGTAIDWESVSAGGMQSLALKNDNSLWVWGKIGVGTHDGSTVQVKIASSKPWRSMVAGQFHVLGIQTDGSLWAWGNNEYSQLGDGTDFSGQTEPTRVGNGLDWAQVSGGAAHTIALKTDGSLWGWGQNGKSQVGVPMPPSQFKSPNRIGSDADWKYVNAGYEHNFAIRNDGAIWAWGSNRSGQLGDGTRLNGVEPAPLHTIDLYTCGNSTLGDVNTGGDQVIWYDAARGGNALNPSTAVVSGNYYYVAQTIGQTESCYRKAVRINSSETAPIGEAFQTRCLGSTLSDLIVGGNNIKWYDAPTGGNELTTSTILNDGGRYYASQQSGTCVSAQRLRVTVTVKSTETPNAPLSQTFCAGATIANFVANGIGLKWYATVTGGSALALNTPLQNNQQYFVSQTVGSCESPRVKVNATINAIPAAPTGERLQALKKNETLADLVVTGQSITWYPSSTDAINRSNVLSPSKIVVDNQTYFATQTLFGCESTEVLSITIAMITSLEPSQVQFSYYPNPVNNYLELKMAADIGSVSVRNTLGQVLFAHQFESEKAMIDFTGVPSGVYFFTNWRRIEQCSGESFERISWGRFPPIFLT